MGQVGARGYLTLTQPICLVSCVTVARSESDMLTQANPGPLRNTYNLTNYPYVNMLCAFRGKVGGFFSWLV